MSRIAFSREEIGTRRSFRCFAFRAGMKTSAHGLMLICVHWRDKISPIRIPVSSAAITTP